MQRKDKTRKKTLKHSSVYTHESSCASLPPLHVGTALTSFRLNDAVLVLSCVGVREGSQKSGSFAFMDSAASRSIRAAASASASAASFSTSEGENDSSDAFRLVPRARGEEIDYQTSIIDGR